jgi:hypothetical protein
MKIANLVLLLGIVVAGFCSAGAANAQSWTSYIGTPGPNAFEWKCPGADSPTDNNIVSIDVQYTYTDRSHIKGLRAYCRRGGYLLANWSDSLSYTRVRCFSSSSYMNHVVGTFGADGRFVEQIGTICEQNPSGVESLRRTGTWSLPNDPDVWRLQGDLCPAGTRVAGIRGETGALLDRVSFYCAPFTIYI